VVWRELKPSIVNEDRTRGARRGRLAATEPDSAEETAALPRRRGPGRPRVRRAEA